MKCKRCKEVIIKKKSSYPMINGKEYCDRCYYFLRWKARIKREEDKKCQKK